MSLLNTITKYPKKYPEQKSFFESLLSEIQEENTNNKTFLGYTGNENLIIGGSSDTNPWSKGVSIRRGSPGGPGATYTLSSSGNTSIVYPTDRWFIISENSRDFNFYRSDNSISSTDDFTSYFSYYGVFDSTLTTYQWVGTIISTDIFEQAIGEDLTLSFWARGSSVLDNQNLVVSLWKLADGTNWNLPGTANSPTHTCTVSWTMNASAGTWTLYEINIPATSSDWDWGQGVDPAIAVVFQLGAVPSSGTTSNLDTWEEGFYTGYSNSSYYHTDWRSTNFSFTDVVLNVGDTRMGSPKRSAQIEKALCRRYFQFFDAHSSHISGVDYWQPYKPELITTPSLLTVVTQGGIEDVLYPQIDTPFTNPSGNDTPSVWVDPLTKSGVFGLNVPSSVSNYRFAAHADYYFGEEI